MPKILIVCEYASLNGGEQSLLSVLPLLVRSSYEIAVAGPASGDLHAAVNELGIEYVPLDLHSAATGSRERPETCRQRLSELLRRQSPDLVHANSLSISRLVAPVAAACQVASMGHLRDIIRINKAAVDDLNRLGRLLAVSSATKEWFVDLGVRPEIIHVLFNGVDLERFRPRHPSGWLHRELGIPTDVVLVGAVGQLGMRKGLDVLATAAGEVVTRSPATHFVIVGQRYSQKQEAVEFEQQLRRQADRPPLGGKVHFLGVREDVDRLLNEFHVVAHAARQEPLGRVLLEAAASGTAVVATDVGGTREIFPDDQAGAWLVPPDDPQAMAAALLRLIEDGQRCDALGTAGRARAVAAFDRRVAAERLLAHYTEMMTGGRQSP